jgi:hemolysin activation/secretion protein
MQAESVPAWATTPTGRMKSLAGGLAARRFSFVLALMLSAAFAVTGPVVADEQDHGPIYRISQLEIIYVHEHPRHPAPEDLLAAQVTLSELDTGYVRPFGEEPRITFRLDELDGTEVRHFHATGLQVVLERLRDALVARRLMGVYVAPDVRDIDPVGQDLRDPDQTVLRLTITTGLVSEVRTLASGARIKPEERLNHRVHQRIRDRSPLQPHDVIDEERLDLLRKDQLDRYVYHLSRHPGRRVDAAVSAGLEPGTVTLDYYVTENRPLVLYAQSREYWHRQTRRWRQRFGIIHNQLTNNDDILNLDYTTTEFDTTHHFNGSYEAPLGPLDRIRWRVFGHWGEFTASDVGFFDAQFTGESYGVGGEIRPNIYQKDELFIDFVAGVRYENIEVETRIFNIPIVQGEQDFLFPYVGLRLDRESTWFTTRGQLNFEFQRGSVTSVDEFELNRLGRTAPDRDWEVMRWGLFHSFFLEPVFNYEAWRDPQTPETSTLAHELALAFRGQYAFDNRLIPQAQQTAGGLYTVRGYRESLVAGDTVLIGSAEYRFHIPRVFGLEPEPRELLGQPFRFAPQQVYGRPDWDLIFRGFVDVGRTINSKRLAFESDETLVGAGIGVELLLRRNINVRLDWGFALRDARDGAAKSGDSRLHFVATLLF